MVKGLKLALIMGLTLIPNESILANTQKLKLKNNEEGVIIMSKKELTRLNFKQEKVKGVYGVSGELEHEMVDDDLFLMNNGDKPLNFFVKTEEGNTYKLLAKVKDIPAVQIFVENSDIKKVNHNLDINAESRELSKIIKVALVEGEHLGYELERIGGKTEKVKGLKARRTLKVTGHFYEVEKYVIENDSKGEVSLNLSDVEVKDSYGLYMEKSKLGVGEKGVMMRIAKR